ncbi:MAG: GGDEF domain-containing protein [Thermoleophilia bacterium]|nr:GGDEF domain-containing protein [Thermoleophilia bacterium]
MDQGELNEPGDFSFPSSVGSRKVDGRVNSSIDTRSPIVRKASSSLKSRETEVIKAWLVQVIDSLGLTSLQAFPTRELTEGFPAVIDGVADAIAEPETAHSVRKEVTEVSALLARLRKEDASVDRFIDDYSLLKSLMFEAAAADLRQSDMAVLNITRNLEAGFSSILKEGFKAFVEQHSSTLQHLADTDALTGLYNVRFFRSQLHKNLEMFKRYRIPFSLMMLDMDNLKELNDASGHQAGDLALKHLSAIMTDEKRETDIAVRYGGDEFFLVLPGTGAAEGERLAYRIVRRVRQLNIHSGGRDITGVSIGVVACPENGSDVGTLRAKADRALYLAKAIGGASVACFQEFYES